MACLASGIMIDRKPLCDSGPNRWEVLLDFRVAAALLLCGSMSLQQVSAGDRLLATGGVSQVEGSGGGGLVPWALITGLGTVDEVGGSAFCTKFAERVHPREPAWHLEFIGWKSPLLESISV